MIAKGKNEKAEKALCWLRGWVTPEMVKSELLELIHYNENSGIQEYNNVNTDNTSLFSKFAQFKKPSVYRPLKMLMFCFFVSYLVSIIPAKPFIGKIMTEVGILNNQSLYLV